MKRYIPTLLLALTTCVFAGLYLAERNQTPVDAQAPNEEPDSKRRPQIKPKRQMRLTKNDPMPPETAPESDDIMNAFDLALEEIAPASTNVNPQANLASNITSMITSAIGEAFKPGSEMSKMMKDQELLGTMQRVGRNYGTLMQDFGLSYREQQEFTDLVTAYEQAGRFDPMSMLRSGEGTNTSFNIDFNGAKMKEQREKRAEAQALAEEDLETYLGDERYKDYTYYRKTLGARNGVRDLQRDLADGDLLLNRTQQEAMVNLYDKHGLSSNQRRGRGGWGAGGGRGNTPHVMTFEAGDQASGAAASSVQIAGADAAGAININPKDDRTEQRLDRKAAQYDAVLNDAEADLSAQQHQALERHFERQLRQDEIQAQQQRRFRQMFQGGGGLQQLLGAPPTGK